MKHLEIALDERPDAGALWLMIRRYRRSGLLAYQA